MDSIKITNSTDGFYIQNSFVDNHIKDANAAYIKVYLYIARHCNGCCELSLDRIAEDTGLIKSDIISALKYWDKAGVVSYSSTELCLNPSKVASSSSEEDATPESGKHYFQPNTSVASAYKSSEVLSTVSSNEALAHFFAVVSQLLNKTLTSNDYKIIYSFIDYLKLPQQVVIILLEYCVSAGKTNLRYIEKIAYSWADNGINTAEAAVEYVKLQAKNNSVLTSYKKKFKVTGRDFSETEEKYILTWLNEYKATEQLIMQAYDTAIMNTGKLSFKYMDAVIRAELESTGANSREKLPSNVKKSTFRNLPKDTKMSDIERRMLERMMAQAGGADDAINE